MLWPKDNKKHESDLLSRCSQFLGFQQALFRGLETRSSSAPGFRVICADRDHLLIHPREKVADERPLWAKDKLRRPDRQELCIRFNTNGRSACSDLGSSQSRAHIPLFLSLTCRPTLEDFLVPFLSIFHLDSRLLGKYNLNESYLQFDKRLPQSRIDFCSHQSNQRRPHRAGRG